MLSIKLDSWEKACRQTEQIKEETVTEDVNKQKQIKERIVVKALNWVTSHYCSTQRDYLPLMAIL